MRNVADNVENATHDEFVDRPHRQFVEQPRDGAIRSAQTTSPSHTPQHSEQSSNNPSRQAGLGNLISVHEAHVGTGGVRVTTGETVSYINANGQTVIVSDLIGLEYTNQSAGGTNLVQRSHWLQFVWQEIRCTTTQQRTFNAAGVIPVGFILFPLTTNAANPLWGVDTLPPQGLGQSQVIIPWYDYPSQSGTSVLAGGMMIRTSTSLKIFDAPSPGMDPVGHIRDILNERPNRAQINPRETVITAVWEFHFDTYLVQSFNVYYHVPWTASFLFTGLDHPETVRQSPRTYSIGSPGPISRLPRSLYSALIRDYPAYDHVSHER